MECISSHRKILEFGYQLFFQIHQKEIGISKIFRSLMFGPLQMLTPKEQPQDTTHVKTQTRKHTSSACVFHRLTTFTQIFLSPFDILHSGQRRVTCCKKNQNLCDILRCDILR